MLRAKARWIRFFDVILRPTPPQAKGVVFDLNELINLISPRIGTIGAFQRLRKATASCRIIGISNEADADYAVLLIEYTDSNASDPAFSHLETGRSRYARKQDGEGLSLSAHLVIQKTETTEGSQRYQALLEEVPGLNSSRVEAFLTYMSAQVSPGRYFYRTQAGVEKPCRPLVTLEGHASDTLMGAINAGELKEIALITQDRITEGLDEDRYIAQREQTVIIKAEPKRSATEKRSLLTTIFGKAKQDRVGKMTVRFTENSKSQGVDVDLTKERIDDTLIIKAEMVELDETLDSHNPTIRADLVQEMLTLLG